MLKIIKAHKNRIYKYIIIIFMIKFKTNLIAKIGKYYVNFKFAQKKMSEVDKLN